MKTSELPLPHTNSLFQAALCRQSFSAEAIPPQRIVDSVDISGAERALSGARTHGNRVDSGSAHFMNRHPELVSRYGLWLTPKSNEHDSGLNPVLAEPVEALSFLFNDVPKKEQPFDRLREDGGELQSMHLG